MRVIKSIAKDLLDVKITSENRPANSAANSAAGRVLTPQIPLLTGPAELCQPIDI
jgi:hypothetical protein